MKKLIIPALILCAATAGAATVDHVLVCQQWPWQENILVEYMLKGVTEPTDITVEASQDGGVTYAKVPDSALSGVRFAVTDEVGTITIDPKKAFSAKKINDLKVRLSLSTASDSLEALYKIFDLVTGTCTDVTRAEILNGKYGSYEVDYGKIGDGFSTGLDDVVIWTGVTNNTAYRTTKMVMRKIHAKDKVWQSGDTEYKSAVNGSPVRTRYWNKLTYDYYIGVFEVTLSQYKLICNAYPRDASVTSRRSGDTEPYLTPTMYIAAGQVYGANVSSGGSPSKGMVTGEPICFPTNSYVRDVSANSAAGKMWTKTGYEFTLPTVAEWEFACMGGNTSSLYSGLPFSTDANRTLLGWTKSNSDGDIHFGGEKPCNAYGLYDMLGNVMEYVLGEGNLNVGGAAGSGDGSLADKCVIDPLGNLNTTKNTSPTFAGGAWGHKDSKQYIAGWHDSCALRHANRHSGYVEAWSYRDFIGFRFVMPATANGKWADHD